jgi:hypothetical protein
MVLVFGLLLLFLILGLFVRSFNTKTRLLLIALIIGMIIYFYLT